MRKSPDCQIHGTGDGGSNTGSSTGDGGSSSSNGGSSSERRLCDGLLTLTVLPSV